MIRLSYRILGTPRDVPSHHVSICTSWNNFKHTYKNTYVRITDVLDVWETIPGTGQAHVKDCHRLIKDTAAEKGRVTLQSYLHNLQPEGCEVEPQRGHFYLKPKGTCIKETGVNESLCSMTEGKTPILQLSWYGIYVPTLLDSTWQDTVLLFYYYLHFTLHSFRRRTFCGKNNKAF